MTTLSPVEPDTEFSDLEPLACDAADIANVLLALIDELFGKRCPEGGYIINAEEGNRLFFVAGLTSAMASKVREAWYVAVENDGKERAA